MVKIEENVPAWPGFIKAAPRAVLYWQTGGVTGVDMMAMASGRPSPKAPGFRGRAQLFRGRAHLALVLALGLAGCAGPGQGLSAAESAEPTSAQAQTQAQTQSQIQAQPRVLRIDARPSSGFGNYLAGRHARTIRDMGLAADLFAHTLVFDPDNPELVRNTFQLMAVEGRIREAAKLARHLVKLRPKSTLAHVVLVVEDVRAGDFDSADKRLDALPANSFNDFLVPMLRAWAKVGAKRPQQAAKVLAPLAKRRGLKLFVDFHSGLIADIAGDKLGAESSYKKALPDAMSGYLRFVETIGKFYERTGRAGKAMALYKDYEAEHPDITLVAAAAARIAKGRRPEPTVTSAREGMAEALFNLASLMHQDNLSEISLILTRLALSLRPNLSVARLLLADILERQRRYDDAIAVYDHVDPSSQLSWAALLRAAALLDYLDRSGEAISRLRAMAAERVKRSDALIALGDILRKRRRYPEAVKVYDRAIGRIAKVDKRHWSVLYARGIALERSKQWARAESDLLRALAFRPNDPHVLNYLGYSWAEQGINLKKAHKMVKMASRLRPRDGYIMDSVGWVLYRMGEFARAATHLERAIELRPQDPVINDHLGDAYWRVGRETEARFQWRRVLSLKPDPALVPGIETKLSQGLGPTDAERRKTAKQGKAGHGG